MNYFEILDVGQDVTDAQALATAYHAARTKWQTLLSQGIGEQQRLARMLMNGGLETAYETLANPTRRQQYLRELKLAEETGIPLSQGRVRVSFSLANGHADHDFLVVDNPVRHPLESHGLAIASLQEYVCRAWEDPDLGTQHLSDRTLERWVRYAAGDRDLADAIRYLAWEPDSLPEERQLGIALDLIQSKYPAPILPRSPGDLAARLPRLLADHWRADPPVVNIGLLATDQPVTVTLRLYIWGDDPGPVTAEVDHPALRVNLTALAQDQIQITVSPSALQRGELLEETLVVKSARLGSKQVPILAARAGRGWDNQALSVSLHTAVGKAALDLREYRTALRALRVAGASQELAAAALGLLEQATARHDWLGVIQTAHYYRQQVSARHPEVQLRLVEALRMVTGTTLQLGEHRRALEYLATLACETAYLPDPAVLASSWTAQPEAQLALDPFDPKSTWVQITEAYGLNWTHATGRADGSHYAGEVPLDLSARRILWRSRTPPLAAPLLAFEGVLFANLADNSGVAARDAASGRILWRHAWTTTGGKPAAPVAGGTCFYAGDPAGTLHAFDALSGQKQWSVGLADAHDLALAYSDGILYVGTGKRLALYDAATGAALFVSDEMTTLFGLLESNPQHILISDGCCLFQKVGGTDPSMVFVDLQEGSTLEFDMPFQRSLVGSLLGRLFTGRSGSAVTWAAYEGEVYLPLILTMQVECRSSYRDAEGRRREQVERKTWGELHLYVYQVRHNKVVAHYSDLLWGTAYAANQACQVTIQDVQAARACAVTPTYIERDGDSNVFYPPVDGKPLHRLVATAFDRDIYYWISTHDTVKPVGYRRVDSAVEAIAYVGLYDLATTSGSLTTSFVGKTVDGNATALAMPPDLKGTVGAPALYCDVIYLLSNAGGVIALGR